jgi:hypothetical protein
LVKHSGGLDQGAKEVSRANQFQALRTFDLRLLMLFLSGTAFQVAGIQQALK